MTDFLDKARNALSAPVREYFKARERVSNVPRTGIGRILAPIAERLNAMRALSNLRSALRNTISRLHIEAGKRGAGGSLELGDYATVQGRINEQMQYLNGFLREVDTLSEAKALARAESYAAAASQTESVLAAFDIMGILPHHPGDRDLACNGFCACDLQVERLGPNDYDVYWDLNDLAEHCEDCKALAEAWRPLRIRKGEIV